MRMTGECSRAAVLMAFAIASLCYSRSLAGQVIPTAVCVDKRGCGAAPVATPSRGSTDNPASGDAARAASVKAANAAAEAAAEAAVRAAAEQRAAEAKRIADKAEADARFTRELGTVKLKGAGSASAPGNQTVLKGGSALTLKSGSTPASTASEKQQLAWKQLHCATAMARKALEALQSQNTASQFEALQADAFAALDGGKRSVACDTAPEMPARTSSGAAVDFEAGKLAERTILDRAGELAKQMSAQPVTPGITAAVPGSRSSPAAPETEIAKIRRVQRELNQINSMKTGTTQASINERESIRVKLATLVLVNNNLAKGETVDINVILTDAPAPPVKRPITKPKSEK